MGFLRRLCRLFLFALAGLGLRAAEPVVAPTYQPLLVISLDGFRWDYRLLHPEATPTLNRLAAEGASARALIPVFPTNTFPNHYSAVTGRRPRETGVINNSMYDPARGRFFRNTLPQAVRDPAWWGAEPVWVTAIRQGRKAATSFWVGSEAPVGGVRPTWFRPFDPAMPFATRRDEVLSWIRRPAGDRPDLITFYLEESNSVGHRRGPESAEMAEAMTVLDRQLGELLRLLAEAGAEPNVVVMSDHGMTDTRPERCVALDDYLDLSTVQVDFAGPVAGLRPLTTTVEAVLARLARLPGGARVFTPATLPSHLYLSGNDRIPPVIVVAGEGGWIERRAQIEKFFPTTLGEHGYDPLLPSMHGTLVVHGPAFRQDGAVIEAVENIHLYALLCAVMGIEAGPHDGDQRLVDALLRR